MRLSRGEHGAQAWEAIGLLAWLYIVRSLAMFDVYSRSMPLADCSWMFNTKEGEGGNDVIFFVLAMETERNPKTPTISTIKSWSIEL